MGYNGRMETTAYYDGEVQRKHPGVRQEWVERVLANPYHSETQPDGRIRYWGYIQEADKWLRVIVADGKLLNRFFDHKKLNQWGRP